MHALILAAGLLIDAAAGNLRRLAPRTGHPIAWLHGLVAWAALGWDRADEDAQTRYARGVVVLTVGVIVMVALGNAISFGRSAIPGGAIVEVALVALLLGGRRLDDDLRALARTLWQDAEAGRSLAATVLGRDQTGREVGDIARDAVTSLARRLTEEVVAPGLAYLLLGLPGLLAAVLIQVAANADSRGEDGGMPAFGKAAVEARAIIDWPAERLLAGFLCLASIAAPGAHGFAGFRAFRAGMRRRANAGLSLPVATIAAALALDDRPDGKGPVGVAEIWAGLRLARAAWGMFLALMLLIAVF